MTNIEEIQKLIYIKDYANIDAFQKKIVEKLIESLAFDMYEEICKENRICPVCGKTLNSDGKIVVHDDRNNNNIAITADICPDDHCKYNKYIVKKYEEAYQYQTSGIGNPELTNNGWYKKA